MTRGSAVRSQVHMLTVAAARLEQDRANPLLIEALRESAKALASRKVQGRGYTKEDAERIECQRAAFHKARSGAEIRDLLLQRAYDLLWEGFATECDALLEFISTADATAMLDAWSADQEGQAPKSKWYEAT